MAVPQSDPNVKAPAAVRAAAARAERVHKENYAKEPEPTTTTETTPPPTAEATPPEPVVTAEVTPPPAPEPVQPPPPTVDWEHKFNSMKGRYEREASHVKGLSEQVTQLQNVIASMQAQQPVQPATPSVSSKVTSLTPEEEAEYGTDFLDVIGRKAKASVSPEVEALRAELAAVKKQLEGVGGTIAQDARGRMLSSLDQDIPNWREVNDDQNFLSWLRLPDTYSGVIRHELLKAAFARNDTPRVLAFFKGFLTEEATVAPAAPQDPTAAPAPGKVPLADLAAPGRAKSPAANNAPAEKPIISRAQIAAFYADVAAGRYRGRDAEKVTNEKMIFAAEREGRIRG
jgi:hypothetical protein